MKKFLLIIVVIATLCFFLTSCIFDDFNYEHHDSDVYKNAPVIQTFNTDASNGMYAAKFGNNIVYFTGEELRFLNLETNVDTVIYEAEKVTYITLNDNHIFFVLEWTNLYQIDYSGNLIAHSIPEIPGLYQMFATHEILYLYSFPPHSNAYSVPISNISETVAYQTKVPNEGLKYLTKTHQYEIEDVNDSVKMVHEYLEHNYESHGFLVSNGSVLNQIHYTCPGLTDATFDENLICYYDVNSSLLFAQNNDIAIVDNQYLYDNFLNENTKFVTSVVRDDEYFFVTSEWNEYDSRKKIHNHVSDKLHKINLKTGKYDLLLQTKSEEFIIGFKDNIVALINNNCISTYDLNQECYIEEFAYDDYEGIRHISILDDIIFIHIADDEYAEQVNLLAVVHM